MTAPVRGIRTPGKRRASSRDERMTGRDRDLGVVERRGAPGSRRAPSRHPDPCASACSAPSAMDDRHRSPARRRSGSPTRRVPRASRIVRSPGPRESGASVRRRSSGPLTTRVRVGICNDADTVSRVDREHGAEIPEIGVSMLRSPQTCDASRSSRAWRSSPSLPRSPSPVQSVRGSPAPSHRGPRSLPQVEVAALARGTAMTIQPQDPGARSAGSLDRRFDPDRARPANESPTGLRFDHPSRSRPAGTVSTHPWHHDREHLVVRPGLYGNGTACGQTLTKTLVGVAHRTLPCGTLVTFRYNGVTLTVPVIDRGPYVSGRTWDLSSRRLRASSATASPGRSTGSSPPRS